MVNKRLIFHRQMRQRSPSWAPATRQAGWLEEFTAGFLIRLFQPLTHAHAQFASDAVTSATAAIPRDRRTAMPIKSSALLQRSVSASPRGSRLNHTLIITIHYREAAML